MEEGRLAARLLSEISCAREAIAASYLSLWRRGGRLSRQHSDEASRALSPQDAWQPNSPSSPGEDEQP